MLLLRHGAQACVNVGNAEFAADACDRNIASELCRTSTSFATTAAGDATLMDPVNVSSSPANLLSFFGGALFALCAMCCCFFWRIGVQTFYGIGLKQIQDKKVDGRSDEPPTNSKSQATTMV
ncbi:hypothetical protein AB1Y20_011910 [Prymnesium parvum]|uniref:H(+)-exporting diphosphatase n=1 Tax=Prymnesium parvum TaxID=97485 RepID=A0AB34IMY2_PRYPA